VTVIAHIGAIVWQGGENRFAIAVFRSYAGSFWHWLAASAAEFGLEVESP
jgi:sarcosine oxidase subunit gamma